MIQRRIAAVWMRGGTSKGLFFHSRHLPPAGAQRDALLLRCMGSPDPYGKQIDGIGGAVSSTSKVVLIERSTLPDHDVDYLFGHVAIREAIIDWSGNCGNLTAAVGPFAIEEGLITANDGIATVRIRQRNIGKSILAEVPVQQGLPAVDGELRVDGVPWPGAPIQLSFLDPGGSAECPHLLPTGRTLDQLNIPGSGSIDASLINAGNPTVFVRAADLGLSGSESPAEVNGNLPLLQQLEAIRAHGAVAMGLGANAHEISRDRPATPKISFVAPPAAYVASNGQTISAEAIDLRARILSIGQLHHAYTGTGAVALAVAAQLPGSLVQACIERPRDGLLIRLGHVAGTLEVGAEVTRDAAGWRAVRVVMQRTARRLMEGHVLLPQMPADTR
jgi:probable AcnD-accessory protein PrpF